MTLIELTRLPVWELPIAGLRNHLRMGTGFSDADLQDEVLEPCLRAAIAAIEARTGKALLARSFRWIVYGWRSPQQQGLPIAPVSEITGVTLITRHGDEAPVALDCLRLVQDSQRPLLKSVCSRLPEVPVGGRTEVTFTAGFSLDWAGLPGDLAQAVMLLAAYFYERRGESPEKDGNMPFAVTSLIERYRTVRILGGARA